MYYFDIFFGVTHEILMPRKYPTLYNDYNEVIVVLFIYGRSVGYWRYRVTQ